MEIKVKSIFFDLFVYFSPESDEFLVNCSCVLVFWMVPLKMERGFLQVLVQSLGQGSQTLRKPRDKVMERRKKSHCHLAKHSSTATRNVNCSRPRTSKQAMSLHLCEQLL